VNSAGTPGSALTGKRALTSVLAIIGILGIILGLLYAFAAKSLPNMMLGHVHAGHHVVRAGTSIVVGLAFLVAAWLAGRRRPPGPGT
jgi:1,4-dihydroxy-2-naphthoate octaprenyltransferase